MNGRNKAYLKINHEPLIKRQLRLLGKIFKQIIIVSSNSKEYRKLKGVKVVPDVIAHLGPLGGIYSGLLASKDKHNFVVACDMPFLNEALIEYLINIKDDYDITIPKIDGKFHPLFGIYSKNCIPVIGEMLKQNRLNVSSIFPRATSRFISKKELEKFDKNLLSLVNVNTKRDLLAAQKITKRVFPR